VSPEETIHASCVAIGGRGVLLRGRSGSGKSDLALRLIDRGAALVSDDYTRLRVESGRLLASAPDTISGRIEVRGLGIVEMPAARETPVCLLADLDREVPRMPPQDDSESLLGTDIPRLSISALEPSAPIKVELALKRLGISLP
jgi:serine kinase of HPr protein (carbohydrate metabolism regulator)